MSAPRFCIAFFMAPCFSSASFCCSISFTSRIFTSGPDDPLMTGSIFSAYFWLSAATLLACSSVRPSRERIIAFCAFARSAGVVSLRPSSCAEALAVTSRTATVRARAGVGSLIVPPRPGS